MLFKFLNHRFDTGINYEKIIIPVFHSGSYERITQDNMDKLYKTFDDSLMGLRNLAICKTLYDTGCRISELLQLQRDVTSEVEITGAKTGNKRVVFITDETLKIIRKYLAKRTDNLPDLFVSLYGNPFSVKSLETIMRLWGIKAGIHVHAHMFRKAIATDLAERSNGNLHLVGKYLGHKSIETTQIYVKYDDIQVKKFYKKYTCKSNELNFSLKKNNDVILELNGWCKTSQSKKMKEAINKAISKVLK